jgi:hypothetical protein
LKIMPNIGTSESPTQKEELETTNEGLQSRLDEIADIIGDNDEEEDEDEDEGEDDDQGED